MCEMEQNKNTKFYLPKSSKKDASDLEKHRSNCQLMQIKRCFQNHVTHMQFTAVKL